MGCNKNIMLRIFYTTALLLFSLGLTAQQGKWEKISLKDLSSFDTPKGNWSIVADVRMDPERTVGKKFQAPPPKPTEVPKRKKKRKKKQKQEVEPAWIPPINWTEGTGVLLNLNNDSLRGNLLTNWEHADLELEIEVMVPKGSNSGIYFQGRYEIQVFDSYGKKNPKFGDMGGVYRKWGGKEEEVYMGKPPFVNVAKLPGTWQKFKIGFQAPKFDKAGKKIANAKFIYVDLNGVRIHQNVEVPYPTRGAMSNKEISHGPLRIQGDHGPVAFRNIRYRKLAPRPLTIQDIRYTAYKGMFTSMDQLDQLEKIAEGSQEKLSCDIVGLRAPFTIVYEGNLHAGESGENLLRLAMMGSFQFDMDGKILAEHRNKNKWNINHTARLKLDLEEGDNPFTLVFHKQFVRHQPGLGAFSENSYPIALHDFDSYKPKPKQAPIELEVLNRTRLLRGFLRFKKGPHKTLTHTIAVGSPQGVHFVYDLKRATPACVWRGPFINTAPMWVARAGGTFDMLGAVEYLFSGHSFAYLQDSTAAFPELLEEKGGFHNKGYKIDKATGLPIFLYQVNSMEVSDMLKPNQDGTSLTRKLTFAKGNSTDGLFLKLAEGKEIHKLANGNYMIDQQHYVKVPKDQKVMVRTVGNSSELIAPIQSEAFHYSIYW